MFLGLLLIVGDPNLTTPTTLLVVVSSTIHLCVLPGIASSIGFDAVKLRVSEYNHWLYLDDVLGSVSTTWTSKFMSFGCILNASKNSDSAPNNDPGLSPIRSFFTKRR